MPKTIAIIESCDTKYKEAAFLKKQVTDAGLNALVVDVATGPNPSREFDISRDRVAESAGVCWEKDTVSWTKGEKIAFMQKAVAGYIRALYDAGKVHGILSVGGLQNTVMATESMKALPIGVPKVIATTVACGKRAFDQVVGERDIVVIPSICDFTGLNMVTRQIMINACACCVGMVKQEGAGEPVRKPDRPVVGVTLMGISNTGGVSAIEELERHGIECIGFHSTGVGGSIMEGMAEDGLIDGILDLTTHEIAEGHFGRGFSYGPAWNRRILRSLEAGVPLVVCPGGLDFCDFAVNEFPPRMDERVYMMHNGSVAHIKLLPEEAEEIAADFVSRIETAKHRIRLIYPTEGMRNNTRPGQELYYPPVDEIILKAVRGVKNPLVTLVEIPGNLDTQEWGRLAAQEMIRELRERQVIA